MVRLMVGGTDSPNGTGLCPRFEISQRDDADGMLRVALSGELDLAVSGRLRAQLNDLQRAKRPVRLDLSDLDFIDCSGVGAIVNALDDARRNRWRLEVDRLVSPVVARIVTLAGVTCDLWPAEVAGVPCAGAAQP